MTGISGCGFRDILAKIASEDVLWIDMGDTMQRVAKEKGFPYEDMSILDSPERELALLRDLAAERILRDMDGLRDRGNHKAVIVSLHATFKWRGVFTSGFSPQFLSEFAPDLCVNVIDDLDRMKLSLEQNPKWAGQRLTWDDVLDWREIEGFTTNLLARSVRSPFYIFAAQEPTDILKDLILKPERKKAYLSFSITHSDEEALEKTERARDRLRELLVVFDPYSMKENALQSRDDIPENVKTRIANMVVHRDYQLISQSDYVLVYLPEERFSQGVSTEIVYGFTSGKKVYTVWPHDVESPFLKFHRHQAHRTVDDLVASLEKELQVPAEHG